MSIEIPGRTIGTMLSGSDLSTKQYRFHKENSSQQIIPCTVAGEDALGVLQNAPTSGHAATLMADGVSKVVAGAAIAAAAAVATDNAGRAVTAASGNKILGYCVIPAAAAGEICSVSLDKGPIAP